MRRLLPFLCLLASVHWAQGQATNTIFVNGDPAIDDAQRDGSRLTPWKTIQQAIDKANDVPLAAGLVVIEVMSFSDAATLPVYQLGDGISITRSIELTTNDAGLVALQGSGTGGRALFTIDTPDTVRFSNFIVYGTALSTGIVITDAANLVIANNTFQSFGIGIDVQNASQQVVFSENAFIDNTVGISIANGNSEEVDGTLEDLDLTVFSNSFTVSEESKAINNQSDKVINAEYNWWGSREADLVTATAGGNVDYSPWLNAGDDDATFGFQGDLSQVVLGGGPQYDSTRNELQEAYNRESTQELSLVGNLAYDSLNATKRATLRIAESDTDTVRIEKVIINISDSDSLLVEGKLWIDTALALDKGSIATIGEASQVTLGVNVRIPDEANGRGMRGNFTIAPRPVGTGSISEILGVSIAGKLDGPDDLGNMRITRINGNEAVTEATVDGKENKSIKVKWIIETDNEVKNGNDAPNGRKITFRWYSDDDNSSDGESFDDDNAVVWRLGDEEGATWQEIGSDETSVENEEGLREVTVSGIKEFSTWTISNENSPLPVTLTDFTARLDKSSVRLDWTTASEINSDYFGIERSTDGLTYEPLARSKAAGDTQAAQYYLYIDEGVTNRLAGIVYYRLHLVDFDGSSEYSPVVAVSLEGERPLLVYANREEGTFTLFASLPEAAYTVQVSDLLGNIVYEAYLPTQPGMREYALPVPPLPQSVYTLRCRGGREMLVRKFRVE